METIIDDSGAVGSNSKFSGVAAQALTEDSGGTISVANANKLSGATTGKVTATIATGSLATLNGLSAAAQPANGDAFALTLNDTSVDAGDLATLDSKVDQAGGGSINMNTVVKLTGTLTEAQTFITNKDNFTNNSNVVDVTLDAAAIGDASDLTTLSTDIRALGGGTAELDLTNITAITGDFSSLNTIISNSGAVGSNEKFSGLSLIHI